MKKALFCLLAMMPLAAQVPAGWNQRDTLGADVAGTGAWYGAGIWSGNHHGPLDNLTDSLGMGNSLTGTGMHVEGGYRAGHWDLAAEGLASRNDQGAKYLTLYRSHIWYRGDKGWQGGFEQEPLVWGYGLNGGYLLGEADRPFPRLRVESPMAALHIGPVPMGVWGWQAFMGRMENHRVVSSSIQNPSWTERSIAGQGTPEAPMLMGYRVQAEFGPLMEFYLNTVNFWSGTVNGRGLTQGYNAADYATAIFGIKDGLAEANTDYTIPGQQAPPLVNKAVSATEIDVGFRLRVPVLARALKAESSYLYISRGSKTAAWPVGVFAKRPLHYLGKDASFDLNNLVLNPNWGFWWNSQYRYSAPTIQYPNDTVGILADWSRVRAGLEYFACSDLATHGFRPFTHSTYTTGFYYYGDPLGNAVAGEAVSTSAKLEVDATPRLTFATTVMRGFRPFRDDLTDWQLDHPGRTPGKNRFTILQECLAWKAGERVTVGLGASWQRQGAVLNVAGAGGDGYAWFADVSFHSPSRR